MVLQEQKMATGGLKLIKEMNDILRGQNIIGFIKKTKTKFVRPCRTHG
jgi:hypothetical protein